MAKKFICITLVLLISACATPQTPNHQGIDWGSGTCPPVAPENLDSKGNLLLAPGKTLKCQLRPFLADIACQGVTDGTETEAFVCQGGNGVQMIFLFDKNGVLIRTKGRNS